MPSIHTHLTERQFLACLEQQCCAKAHLYTGDKKFPLFVYERKGRQFWLGEYTYVGRSHGFLSTRLNCQYETAPNGLVVITYRRAKHPVHAVLHWLALVLGAFFCVHSFINVFRHFEIGELIFPLAFLAVGVVGLVIKPAKEWRALETQLHVICNAQ